MVQYLLAHDLGTSGNKASLFRTDGTLVASVLKDYPTHYPQRGWAEQDPADWWSAVSSASREVVAGIDPQQIAAISFSAHMMGCLCLDKSGQPLHRSIIWSDGRATAEAEYIVSQVGLAHSYQIVGQQVNANYTLAKLLWLKKHQPEIYENAAYVVQCKDYIAYRMSGVIATDHTDAAYTQTYDLKTGTYSNEMLAAAGIRKDILPRIVTSDTVLGPLLPAAAAECGLLAGTPVVMGAGDGSAATIGAGCVQEGQAYLCLGSSSWLMATSDRFLFDPQMRTQTEPHVVPGKFAYGGTMQTGGLSYEWAKDNLTSAEFSYRDLEILLQQSQPGAKGCMFLPYLMGERCPWWDPHANGSFLGLRLNTSKADMLRAVLEGVAMNLNVIWNVVKQSIRPDVMYVIGGGGLGDTFMQIFADVFQVPVAVLANTRECNAMGAAVIAGMGAGLFNRDYSITEQFICVEKRFQPDPQLTPMYEQKQQLFEEAYHLLSPLDRKISMLQA